MKIWILLAIAGLLLVWSLSREGFVETMVGDAPTPVAPPENEIVKAICPAGSDLDDKKRCVYPDPPEMFTCPDNYIPTGGRKCRKQGTMEEIDPVCPSGKVFDNADVGWGCVKAYATPTCPSGFTLKSAGWGGEGHECTRPIRRGTTEGTTAGGTTGGSSTSEAAPNAGPVGSTGKGKNVYGPVYTSMGNPVDGGDGVDSSKTNQYPELLGGVGDVTSVRTPSGIQNPSKSWMLMQSGSLPSTASLGSDANSGFLPYSRSPGDQDLIPDPYRLARNYSTASYSSKTDPVPFLTDFSAFQK